MRCRHGLGAAVWKFWGSLVKTEKASEEATNQVGGHTERVLRRPGKNGRSDLGYVAFRAERGANGGGQSEARHGSW